MFFWVFLADLVPKSKFLQTDWNLVPEYTAIFFFEFNVYSFKILVIHIFGSKFVLKFFKLTEIFYRGILLYAHYNFNVYFSRFFVIHIFWANLDPKSGVLQLTNWLKFDARAHCYMVITVLMCNFLKYLPFIFFLGKFHPKINCSSYWLKFNIKIWQTYISQSKLEEALQGCENVLVNKCVFCRFYHFSFAHKQVVKFCIYLFALVFVATSKLPVLCIINCSIQFSVNSMRLIRM